MSTQQPPDLTISGPQSQLTIAEQKLEMPTFPTIQKDWYRLRKAVSRLANPIPWARDLGWCALTLVFAFSLGFVAWLPVKRELSREAQFAFAWITPLLVVGAAAAVVVMILSFSMYGMTEKILRSNVDHLLEDMDEMHTAPPPEPPTPGFFVRV